MRTTNQLYDVLGLILTWLAIFALIFVSEGEPDLWDKWHADLMGNPQPCVAVEQP